MPDLEDKLLTPFNNLESAFEYVTTSQSDVQFRDRVWEVLEDTATINSMCELVSELGSYSAGMLANEMADKYTEKSINTLVTINDQEKLNSQMFQQVAAEKNIDPSLIRGTGLMREFVPDYQKSDLCDWPIKGARPKPFGLGSENDNFLDNDDFWNPKNDGPNSGPKDGKGGDNQGGGMPGSSDDSNFSNLNDESKSSTSTNDSEGNIFGRWLGFNDDTNKCLQSDSNLIHDTSCGESGESFSERAYRWLESSAGSAINWLLDGNGGGDISGPPIDSATYACAAFFDAGIPPEGANCP